LHGQCKTGINIIILYVYLFLLLMLGIKSLITERTFASFTGTFKKKLNN